MEKVLDAKRLTTKEFTVIFSTTFAIATKMFLWIKSQQTVSSPLCFLFTIRNKDKIDQIIILVMPIWTVGI